MKATLTKQLAQYRFDLIRFRKEASVFATCGMRINSRYWLQRAETVEGCIRHIERILSE